MPFHNEYYTGFDPYTGASVKQKVGDYYTSAGIIGGTTSINTPNQLAELGLRLNAGVKNVEISGPLDPNQFEQVPLTHLKEMRRLAKLTDSTVSLHAPMIDLGGFTDQGWNEVERAKTESVVAGIIDKAMVLDPKGNIPITIHTNRSTPAYYWQKGLDVPEGKKPLDYNTMIAIDQDTGQLLPLKYEKKQYPGETKIWMPEERLRSANKTQWDNEKLKVFSYLKDKRELDERSNALQAELAPIDYAKRNNIPLTPEEQQKESLLRQNKDLIDSHVEEIDTRIGSDLQEIYHKFVSYPYNEKNDGNEAERYKTAAKGLKEFIEKYRKQEKFKKEYAETHGNEIVKKVIPPEVIEKLREKNINPINVINPKQIQIAINQKAMEKFGGDYLADDALLHELRDVPAPRQFIPVDEFAKHKVAETVVNSAMYGFERALKDTKDVDKAMKKAPILAIENWYPETILSRGESFRDFLQEARDNFAMELQKKKNLDKEKAREVANNLIGATWDVGHIYMMKRFGYDKGETTKLVLKDVETLAKNNPGIIKKIHLADNFGYADSHLAPGMGDVPIKEQLAMFERFGAFAEGAPLINEAGAFDAQFRESSLPYTFEALGSPLYTHVMAPAWGSIRETFDPYMVGHGNILPDIHFKDLYGGGFSNLPRELGGQVGGDQSRFSGTPNQ
ncbi:MAG TPA: hypothetical protein VJJ23_00960 [Candidatus Nanoarchaeia archaeon]|nr:hypothetical protein [Candidatus Nanoarchaeia archaeon]